MNKNIWVSLFIIPFFFSNCSSDDNSSSVTGSGSPSDTIAAFATNVVVDSLTETTNYISSNSISFLSPTNISLDLQAVGGDDYTQVYGFNVPVANRATGFKWSGDDETSGQWRPQGIAVYSVGSAKFLLVSWYAQTLGYQGSRLSIVDINPNSSTYLKYNHILLVQDSISASSSYTQLNAFAPLNIHVGGIACVKNKLYIASTSLGIRVFDLSKIIEVSTTNASSKCGVDGSGNAYAFGYKYILPQTGYYEIDGANPFSTVQVNAEGTELWTAQYYSKSSSTVYPKAYGFPIDDSGNLKTTGTKVITPRNSYFTNNCAYGMQGIFRKGNSTWLSCTDQPASFNSTARLIKYRDGFLDSEKFQWPYGAESLCYDAGDDYLWSLTEYEVNGGNNGSMDNRCVFAVKFANYQ